MASVRGSHAALERGVPLPHYDGPIRVRSLIELLRLRAERQANQLAYTFLADRERFSLTYGQLDRRARQLGSYLAERSRRQDPVLLLYPAGLEFLEAFFGALYAGLVPVPLPVPRNRAASERVLVVARDTAARLVLSCRAALPEQPRDLAGLEWVFTDEFGPDWDTSFDPVEPRADDVAYLQYTSGSTQLPRGVVLSHANVLHNLWNIDQGFRHTPESVSVTWLPHFHDMGLVYGLLGPLYGGFPCYVFSPAAFIQRPRLWLEVITEFRATHSGGPNFAFDLCVRRIPPDQREGLELSSWQVAFNGAEPVRAETLERFAEAFEPYGFRREAFYPAYGLAEATLKVTGSLRGQGPLIVGFDGDALAQGRVRPANEQTARVRHMVGCGAPGPDTEVRIVNPETRQLCGEDELGEIWVRGPGVAYGYWQQPEATQQTFQARLADGSGPYLRTGDLGFIYQGQLFIAGRLKELIIIRGLNHYPSDLEATVRQAHPALASSLVAAFPIEDGGEERLGLVVETGSRAPDDPQEIVDAVRRAIAENHQIQAWMVVLARKGTIPRTSSGKIQRGLCKELLERGELETFYVSRLEPGIEVGDLQSDWERIREALPAERIGRLVEYLRQRIAALGHVAVQELTAETSLGSVGLDSLAAVELLHRIERELGVVLDPAELWGDKTISELATRLASELATSDVRTTIPALGSKQPPLSFEQERIWWLVQAAPSSAAFNIPFALRWKGPLEPELFQKAVDQIVARQEALRACFPCDASGQPQCWIREDARLEVEVCRIAEGSWQQRIARALEIVAARASQAMDLGHAPLARLVACQCDANEWVVGGALHHLIGDVWSVRLFLEEVATVYASLRGGEPSLLPVLRLQYGDFAAWQRSSLGPERVERLAGWWRDWLAGVSATGLPSARPEAQRPVWSAELYRRELDGQTLDRLDAYCRRHRFTRFHVLFGLFVALLARLARSTDLLVGVTVANRHRADLEHLIGFFATPLPVRIRASWDWSVSEWIRAARQAFLDAQAHQELPVAKIAEALRARGQVGPLFRVVFGIFQEILPRVPLPGVELETLDVRPEAIDFELFFNWADGGDHLRALVSYSRELYSARSVEAFVSDYFAALEQFVENPDMPVSELLTPAWKANVEEASRVAIAATFTAEPVGEVLEFWLKELDFDDTVVFAPYGQLFQQLLDPSSTLRRGKKGVNVLLVRLEDWAPLSVDDRRAALEENLEHFVSAVQSAAARTPVPYLICFLPCSPGFLAEADLAEASRQAEQQAAARLGALATVHVAVSDELLRLYPVGSYYDPTGEREGHVPYTPEMFAAIGTFVARKIHAMRTQPFKVVVLDCDQTLWRGVCGEDGPQNVVIDAPRRALQEFMLRKRDEGMLLCLCSKNEEQDIWETFQAHPEMPLRREHLVAWRINWEPKSTNLRSLAKELNVGLDSFIFVDDSPAECAEVQANAPEVLVLQLPREPERIPEFLEHVWAFDHLSATEEDRKRSLMYGQRLERRRLQQEVSTLAEFLEKLQLRVEIGPMRPEHLSRVAQLTQRTNQMNFTTRRRSEAEIRQLLDEGRAECWVVHLTDRFGSYGLVGVMLVGAEEDALVVDTFLLSCRALGRGVEHRMLAHLGQLAQARGLRELRVPVLATPKNTPARQFMEQVAGRFAEPISGGVLYRLPAEFAAQVTYDPQSAPGEPISTEGSVESPAPAQPRTIDYVRIARELSRPSSVLARIRSSKMAHPVRLAEYIPPRTTLERKLAEIWAQLLNMPRVGVRDNFFDLGGHSLLAIQMLSRIRSELGVDLSLDVLFRGELTVEELAKAIELDQIAQASPEEYEALLAEIESLSDEEARALLEQQENRESVDPREES